MSFNKTFDRFEPSWVSNPDLSTEKAKEISTEAANHVNLSSNLTGSNNYWCVVFFKAQGSDNANYALAYKVMGEMKLTLKANAGTYYITHWMENGDKVVQVAMEVEIP